MLMRTIAENEENIDILDDNDLLEEKYLENQNRIVNDESVLEYLQQEFDEREILLIAPGKTCETEKDSVKSYIRVHNPIVIGVNAINPAYSYDYLFIVNMVRYEYAKEIYPEQFYSTKKFSCQILKPKPLRVN